MVELNYAQDNRTRMFPTIYICVLLVWSSTISWIFRKVATRILILLSTLLLLSQLFFFSVESDDPSPNRIRALVVRHGASESQNNLDLAYDPDWLSLRVILWFLSKNPRLFLLQIPVICQANTSSSALHLLLRQCRCSPPLLWESEAGSQPSFNSVYRSSAWFLIRLTLIKAFAISISLSSHNSNLFFIVLSSTIHNHSQCHTLLRYSMPTRFCSIWSVFDAFILNNPFQWAELNVYRMVPSRTRYQQWRLLGAKSHRI